MAMAFNAGQAVWVVCKGDFDKSPYGMYAATTTALGGNSDVSVKIISDGLALTAAWNAHPPGTAIECSGAPGGENKASLMQRDPDFPAEGYGDMTNMGMLNDAELAMNLRTLYTADNAYCRCGATLVAMNLMKALPVSSSSSSSSPASPRRKMGPSLTRLHVRCTAQRTSRRT